MECQCGPGGRPWRIRKSPVAWRRYCATCASVTSRIGIAPFKMVEEPARVGAVVPDHHRAILLAGQYGFEFGDQFAIGIRHRWLLIWSNRPPRFAGKIMRSKVGRSLAELRGIHALEWRSFTLSPTRD